MSFGGAAGDVFGEFEFFINEFCNTPTKPLCNAL
jgi:hypothetical protein